MPAGRGACDMEYAFSVIIPVFNKWDLTEQCLRSLKACTSGYSYQVIIVDNASTDETRTSLDALAAALFGGDAISIRLPENRNFGPACNLGAQRATAPFLFFLNNDTILTENWAAPLLQAFSRNGNLAAAGPLLLYENNTVQHVGVTFTTSHPIHLYRHFPADHPAVQKERRVQTLTGAALLILRKAFLSVGGFYEEYRNGFEDVDLCLHLCNIGLQLQCIPKSVIYHLESQTPGRNNDNAHNGSILKHRCNSMFHPDLHIHGMRDGFIPVIADNLDISLAMKEEEEARLFAQAEGKSIEYWRDLIVKNPLWLRGRKYIADIAAQQGNYTPALLLYSEIAFWTKKSKDYKKILSFAHMVGDSEKTLLDEARKSLEVITAQTRDLTYLRKKLRDVQKWNDRTLLQLYEAKYAELQRDLQTEC